MSAQMMNVLAELTESAENLKFGVMSWEVGNYEFYILNFGLKNGYICRVV